MVKENRRGREMRNTIEQQAKWINDMTEKYGVVMNRKETSEWNIYGVIPREYMQRVINARRKAESI